MTFIICSLATFTVLGQAPTTATDDVQLGPKTVPTLKLIEGTKYETNTERDWAATFTFEKGEKLKVKVNAQDPGQKRTTKTRSGSWKIWLS